MSYEPKTWVTGDVITAIDLNHMENAIGALYITNTENNNTVTLSASYNDILSAINAGKIVGILQTDDVGTFILYLRSFAIEANKYKASFGESTSTVNFVSDDADSLLTMDSAFG